MTHFFTRRPLNSKVQLDVELEGRGCRVAETGPEIDSRCLQARTYMSLKDVLVMFRQIVLLRRVKRIEQLSSMPGQDRRGSVRQEGGINISESSGPIRPQEGGNGLSKHRHSLDAESTSWHIIAALQRQLLLQALAGLAEVGAGVGVSFLPDPNAAKGPLGLQATIRYDAFSSP